jgi:hypothetical protein
MQQECENSDKEVKFASLDELKGPPASEGQIADATLNKDILGCRLETIARKIVK